MDNRASLAKPKNSIAEVKAALALVATTDEVEAGRVILELLADEELEDSQRHEVAARAAALMFEE